MPSTCRFTVFTQTFNRARTLPRVYESLRQQSFRDFEWLIVDDGSTDDTREVAAAFDESLFPIRYVHQPTGTRRQPAIMAFEKPAESSSSRWISMTRSCLIRWSV